MADQEDGSRRRREAAQVVELECVAGSSKALEWGGGGSVVQERDVVEAVRVGRGSGGGAGSGAALFKGGRAGLHKALHAAFKSGDTSVEVRVSMDTGIGVLVTAVRTVADLFYLAHMILKFRIAFVAPSSCIFERGELVRDPDQIAIRYLKNDFIVFLAAMLPIPQVIIWFIIPAVSTSSDNHTNNTLSLIVLIQYIPRVFLIISLNPKIVKASGVVTRTAWAGVAYNLLLYTLASHVLGAVVSAVH